MSWNPSWAMAYLVGGDVSVDGIVGWNQSRHVGSMWLSAVPSESEPLSEHPISIPEDMSRG